MRVIFMGTADFAVPTLEAIIKAEHEVLAVVTQPDRPKGRGKKLRFCPVKEIAVKYDLNIFQPEKIKDSEAVNYLKSLKPDIFVVVAYGQILSQEILDIAQLGCINVHASLLPKYRGAAPIHWAIINGENETGISIMYMELSLDSGDVILQKSMNITNNDTVGEIHDILSEKGAILLVESLDLIKQNKVLAKKQNDEESTYAPLLTRELEKINWDKTSSDICNLIRGMNPWPGAYTTYQGKILKIFRAKEISKENTNFIPGTVIECCSNEGIAVQCKKGTILITELKPEGKKLMDAASFILGNKIEIGTVLGCD